MKEKSKAFRFWNSNFLKGEGGALVWFAPVFFDITDAMTVGCFALDLMWCGLFEISLHSNLTAVRPPPHHTQTHTGPAVATSQTSNLLRVNECMQPSLWREIKAIAVTFVGCVGTRVRRSYTTEHQHNSSPSHRQIFSALKRSRCLLSRTPELESTLKCPGSPSSIMQSQHFFT